MITIDTKFTPQEITLQDDSRHKKGHISHIETWYYDAILNDNYSIAALANIFTIGFHGFVLTGLFIYKDTKLIKSIQKRHPYRSFYGSEHDLLLKIENKPIVKGFSDKNTEKMTCKITMDNKDTGVDLQYNQIAKGWKMKTYAGYWLVIPRFTVNGNIKINNQNLNVNGRGYHDHNIYSIFTPFITRGWHFGTISIDSNVITWARVKKSRKKENIIVVLNKDNNYIQIDPQDINYKIEKTKKDHNKIIPIQWSLEIDSDILIADINIGTENIHHIGMPTFNYWRNHLRNTGKIKIGSYSKNIDNIEISEYMQFF